MVMTKDEILRDYRAAKSKQNQIGVLADLNCCKSREIVNILLEAGEPVPRNFLTGEMRKKKDVPVAAAPSPGPVTAVLPRAQKPVPVPDAQAYDELIYFCAYASGICQSIEDEKIYQRMDEALGLLWKCIKKIGGGAA